MTSILVVCTGNVCRSPLAEGIVRRALRDRLGEEAPVVSSAGVAGWEGSPATPESVVAARELGIDISGHVARHLTTGMIERADLILAMAEEHRRAVVRAVPSAAPRSFALKELVALLDADPPARPLGAGETEGRLTDRLVIAAALRAGETADTRDGARGDRDVADPLGMPMDTYRDLAEELDALTDRLAAGLYGRATLGPSGAGEGAVA